MQFQARKAEKRKLAVKVLCGGSSGSGKTFSALTLATGIVNKAGGEIFFINTEGDRGEMYADKFDYQIIDMPEPRSPENYINAIQYCIDEGATVIIIDSLSHEWNYLNEQVNNMQGNSFNNWGKQKPRHKKLVDFIVESKVHIIATGRGKDEYVMEANDKGKQTPKKVGVGIQQEKDTEYEFMVTFNIAQDNHVATAMKDNTGLFEGRYNMLTVQDGEALYNWANSGEKAPEKPEPLQQQIITLAKSLGGSANPEVKNAVESNIECVRPTDCNDITKLKKAIKALETLKEKEGK